MKSEEIDESVGIQVGHEIESTGTFEQDQLKEQKIQPRKSERQRHSMEVQSRNELESTKIFDSETLHQEHIKAKSLISKLTILV